MVAGLVVAELVAHDLDALAELVAIVTGGPARPGALVVAMRVAELAAELVAASLDLDALAELVAIAPVAAVVAELVAELVAASLDRAVLAALVAIAPVAAVVAELVAEHALLDLDLDAAVVVCRCRAARPRCARRAGRHRAPRRIEELLDE